MGWWWFGGDADEKRASEIRSGAVAPTRTERRKCWESRDAYFACLDRSGIVDAIKDEKEAASACAAQSSRLDRDCAAEWVRFLPNLGADGQDGSRTEQKTRLTWLSVCPSRSHTSNGPAWQTTRRSSA